MSNAKLYRHSIIVNYKMGICLNIATVVYQIRSVEVGLTQTATHEV